MISDKACYWFAIGVLALGLNANYQDGGVQWGHRLARSAQVAAGRVSGTAYLAIAQVMLGSPGVPVELAGPNPGTAFAVAAPRVRMDVRAASQVRQVEFVKTQARMAAQQTRLASLDEQLRRDFTRGRTRRVYVRIANLPNSEIAIADLP